MKQSIKLTGILALMVALGAVIAWSDPISGNGTAASPFTIYEGVSYALPNFVTAGDVVICESATPCLDINGNLVPGQDSDIVHFPDTTGVNTGNMVQAYCMSNCDSDDIAFPGALSLSIFATSVTEGSGTNALSETAFTEGTTHYLFIDSAPPAKTTTPEPASFILLGSGLLGLAVVIQRKRAAGIS